MSENTFQLPDKMLTVTMGDGRCFRQDEFLMADVVAENGKVVRILCNIPTGNPDQGDKFSPLQDRNRKGKPVKVNFTIPGKKGSLLSRNAKWQYVHESFENKGTNHALVRLTDFEPDLHCEHLGL